MKPSCQLYIFPSLSSLKRINCLQKEQRYLNMREMNSLNLMQGRPSVTNNGDVANQVNGNQTVQGDM